MGKHDRKEMASFGIREHLIVIVTVTPLHNYMQKFPPEAFISASEVTICAKAMARENNLNFIVRRKKTNIVCIPTHKIMLARAIK